MVKQLNPVEASFSSLNRVEILVVPWWNHQFGAADTTRFAQVITWGSSFGDALASAFASAFGEGRGST